MDRKLAVSAAVYEKLQKLAVPLVDTPSSVIERLIDHWVATAPNERGQTNPPSGESASSMAPAQLWRSSRGDTLRVGTSLKGQYLGKTYEAEIEPGGIRFNGELYDNPSAAAVAAKNLAGKTGQGASTNGRDFWRIRDPSTGHWVPISTVQTSPIDPARLLAELAQGKQAIWGSPSDVANVLSELAARK